MDRIIPYLPEPFPLMTLCDPFLSSLEKLARRNRMMNREKECLDYYLQSRCSSSVNLSVPADIICTNCGQTISETEDQQSNEFAVYWYENQIKVKHVSRCQPSLKMDVEGTQASTKSSELHR